MNKIKFPPLKQITQNTIYSFKFMWKYSKIYLIISLLNIVFASLTAPINLILTSRLFTALEKNENFTVALSIILSMLVVTVIISVWGLVFRNVLTLRLKEELHLKVQSDFFKKIRLVELSRYDDPEFYDDFVLTMQYADEYAESALDNINSVIMYVTTISVTVSIIAYVDIYVMLLMILCSTAAVIIDVKKKKIQLKVLLC